jgi:hypothetical protein
MTFYVRISSIQLFVMLISPLVLQTLVPGTLKHIFTPMLNIIFFLLYFGWIYSVASIFYKPWIAGNKNLLFFKISIGILVCSVLFYNLFVLPEKLELFSDRNKNLSFFISAIICVADLYVIYFASKVLRSNELNRNVIIEQHQNEALLFFVFFIGIWFLQPRINKLFDKSD